MSIESFVPKLWASSLDVPYRKNLVYSQTGVANTRFQEVLRRGGKTVTINRLGAVQTREHDASEAITYDKLSTVEHELVMDKERYYAFEVGDVEQVQSANGGELLRQATEEHGFKMADDVDTDTAKVLQQGAKHKLGSKTVFDGADFFRPGEGQTTAWDILRLMSKQLNKVSAPSLNRWVVVGPEMASALLGDRRFSEADKAGTDAVARNGNPTAIPTLGFTVFESQNAPTVASRELVIGGVANSLDFASQLRTSEMLRRETSFANAFRGLHVWGSELSRPEGIVTVEADVKPGTLGSQPSAGEPAD